MFNKKSVIWGTFVLGVAGLVAAWRCELNPVVRLDAPLSIRIGGSPSSLASGAPGPGHNPPEMRAADFESLKASYADEPDTRLQHALAAVTSKLETEAWIDRANRNRLSVEERAQLRLLIAQASAIRVVMAERYLAKVE